MKALMHPATLAVFAVVACGSMLLRWHETPTDAPISSTSHKPHLKQHLLWRGEDSDGR